MTLAEQCMGIVISGDNSMAALAFGSGVWCVLWGLNSFMKTCFAQRKIE